jgi:8-hydroxy-5-deazaflavin:NADPH oxidoreductase
VVSAASEQARFHIGIIGGTGPEGFGLAMRWTHAGESVAIGSRLIARAEEAAARIQAAHPHMCIVGDTNEVVAEQAEIIVVSVPVAALESTLTPLAPALEGRVVVSVVATLEFADGRPRPVLLGAGSAALEIQRLLPGSRVTSGFHTLSAEKLGDLSVSLDEDTVVCGDDREARRTTMELARKIDGIRPISGGRLENSFYPELMVGMLAILNRIHKAHSGFKLVGIE